jgi:hypothetical protein
LSASSVDPSLGTEVETRINHVVAIWKEELH